MYPLRNKALALAHEAHAGQVREGSGLPYVTHPEAVAGMVNNYVASLMNVYGFTVEDDPAGEVFTAVALLHDAVEDRPNLFTFQRIYEELVAVAPIRYAEAVVVALRLLTKTKHESYYAYLGRIKKNEIARVVKIFDITHNLSDLEAGKLRDKYELALYFLKH